MINLQLKDFQQQTVDFLLEKTTEQHKQQQQIIVKSPTGSGKTIILISYIENYLLNYPNTIFCWFTVGKGDLEEQSKEKMERFSPTLPTGNITDVLNQGFECGTTYFINWETITKKGNLALKDSERKNIKQHIADAHRNNKQFIVIIDEEHLNNTAKANDIIDAINAHYEIRVSATPAQNKNAVFYEIDEVDVINEGLITRAMYINKDLNAETVENIQTETTLLLKKANEIRKEIATAYLQENEDIRPLVLIQFPNLNDELIEFVEKQLADMGYTYENKLVAKWMSEENTQDKQRKSKKLGKINVGEIHSKDSVTHNNAEPVFLLFKQALATGWDCPRAKVLVKLRENMSETFEIQTLGRLRRMPNAKHYGRDILDCSYLYTFDEDYKNEVTGNHLGAEYKRVVLKEAARTIELKKELRDKDSDFGNESAVRKQLFSFIKEKYKLTDNCEENKLRFQNQGLKLHAYLEAHYLEGRFETLKKIQEEAAHYQGKSMQYKVDTHEHGLYLRHHIDSLKKYTGLSYEKTRQLLEIYFLKDAGEAKFKLLNLPLKNFYAFIINNVDEFKTLFMEFASSSTKVQHSLDFGDYNQIRLENFSIPIEEMYPIDSQAKERRILERNVYHDYNFTMISGTLRSTSERLFERSCEQNSNVKYVYKNGDSGQNYLSIVYTTQFGKQRLFFPDYIVQTQDGTTWLLETKGGEQANGQDKNIDKHAKVKFNALQDFCQKHGYKFGFIRDKDGELYLNNTEYVDDMSDERWQPLERYI